MMSKEQQKDYRGKLRSKYQTVNNDPSETVQSDAPLADIQKILAKYQEVGIIDHLNDAESVFRDVTEFTDYADAMRNLKVAEQTFMELPSKVREIFHHDVAEWLDAAHDPEKRDALVEAGFVKAPKKEPVEAAPVEPVSPAETGGEKVGEVSGD